MFTPIRTHAERIAVFAGLTLAIVLALNANQSPLAYAQNAGGSGGSQSAAMRLATADVLSVTDKLMTQERYTSAQRTQVESLQRTLQPLQAELEGLVAKARGMEESNPERAGLGQTINARQQNFQSESQRAMEQLESFKTSQAAEAYRIVIEAADALAAELGYTHLIASRGGAVTIRSNNVGGAIQEMLARPVVRSTSADDLTERLMTRLKVTEPPVAAPQAAPGGNGGD